MLSKVSYYSTPFKILIAFINCFPRFYLAKQALPAPPALITAALFKIGNNVHTIPDTTPGVDSRHSVSFYDVVEEVIADAGWIYFIKSVHESRIHMLVPEARVLSTSKSLSDGLLIETRSFPVELMLAAQKEKTSALKRKIFVNYRYSRYITMHHTCGCSYVEYYRDSFKCDILYLHISMFVSHSHLYWYQLLLFFYVLAFIMRK